jgi:hypothetical protein
MFEYVISLFFLALIFFINLFTAARAAAARAPRAAWRPGRSMRDCACQHRTWPDGLSGGYNSPGWLIALTANPPASICHQTT